MRWEWERKRARGLYVHAAASCTVLLFWSLQSVPPTVAGWGGGGGCTGRWWINYYRRGGGRSTLPPPLPTAMYSTGARRPHRRTGLRRRAGSPSSPPPPLNARTDSDTMKPPRDRGAPPRFTYGRRRQQRQQLSRRVTYMYIYNKSPPARRLMAFDFCVPINANYCRRRACAPLARLAASVPTLAFSDDSAPSPENRVCNAGTPRAQCCTHVFTPTPSSYADHAPRSCFVPSLLVPTRSRRPMDPLDEFVAVIFTSMKVRTNRMIFFPPEIRRLHVLIVQ